MNATQKALFWGSFKSAVGVVTGALLTNLADPAYPVFSLLWWKHLGIATGIILLTTEGRYWNQWATSGQQRPLPDAISAAQDAAKDTEQKLAKVQDIAKKEPKAPD